MNTLRIPYPKRGGTKLAAALTWAKAGWYVVPVRPDGKPEDMKHPGSILGRDWDTKSSRDPAQIKRWWKATPDANIAIHTGRSGAVAFDVDNPAKLPDFMAAEFEGQPYLTTSASGARRHYLFAQPAGRTLSNSLGALPKGWGEVRGKNGVIMVYPSQHVDERYPDGAKNPDDPGAYGIGKRGALVEVPGVILERMRDAAEDVEPITNADVKTFFDTYTASDYTKAMQGPIKAYKNRDGARHTSMFDILCWAFREAMTGAYPAKEVADQLHVLWKASFAEANEGRHVPPQEWPALLRDTIAQAMASDPEETRAKMKRPKQAPETPKGIKPKKREWNDPGNGDRVIDYFGSSIRRNVDAGVWHLWDSKRWFRLVDTSMMMNVAEETIKNALLHELPLYDDAPAPAKLKADGTPDARSKEGPSEQERFLKWINSQKAVGHYDRMMKMAASKRGAWCETHEFDADPYLFNCANGIVDLRTGELGPHDPAALITQVSKAAYDPEAKCPTFMAYLKRVQPDPEMRAYLQRVAGYTMTGSTEEQAFFVHHGHGQNGKSVLFKVLRAVFGDYHQKVPKTALMDNKNGGEGIPNDVARMLGKRFLEAQETKAGQMLNNERIKEISDGGTQSARFLNHEFFEFDPVGKIHIVTNFLPNLGAGGFAMERRIHDIGWDVTIPNEERDNTLDARIIENELSGVLAWAVEGARMWMKEGLKMPASVRAKVAEHVRDSDPLAGWVEERTEADVDGVEDALSMFQSYKGYCEDYGNNAMNHKAFFAALVERGYARHANLLKGEKAKHPKNRRVLFYGRKVLPVELADVRPIRRVG